MTGAIDSILQGTLLGGLYALFAAGLSLIFGVMRLVNIAHGDLIVLAAYTAFLAVQLAGIDPLTSLLIVVPAMFLVGYALQRGLLNATLGRGRTGAAHLKMSDSSLADNAPAPFATFLPLLEVLGTMKIEVVSSE